MLNFKTYLERDLYGFVNKDNPIVPSPQDELPIQAFNFTGLMDTLQHMKIRGVEGYRKFEDQVQWGQTIGAVCVRLTPNQGVYIERLTSDFNGNPTWITKRIYKMKTNEYAEQEDTVAYDISDKVQEVASEELDVPINGYKGLFSLVEKLSHRVKGHAVNMFVYEEIKKINENNYNILFSLMGTGTGRLIHSRGRSVGTTPAGIIDLSYNPETGMIRSILSTVDVDNEADPWEISLPYSNCYFSSSQPIEEMVDLIIAGVRFV